MNTVMPIGVDDFKEVREKYYFVDKTDFIRQLIDKHSKVTLITRPRRFGKTLTMSMLEYFYSIDKKDLAKDLFTGLSIEKMGQSYMQHLGSMPVISISLKNVQSDTWDSTLTLFGIFLADLYDKFSYLYDSSKMNDASKEYFSKVWHGKATKEELMVALLRLTKMLQLHYGKPVIVLIDEYDAPVQKAWESGFYDECISFMRQFLGSVLKTNPALDFAVLTGVLRIAKESIFSGLNNLDVCSILRDRYSEVFGFTAKEVAQLAADLNVSSSLPEIKQWYDGYRFGNSEIYNPLSVVSYVDNHCMPQPYWMNTSNNAILQNLLSHADYLRIKALHGLLQDVPVSVSLNEGVNYNQINSDQSALYTMLLTTGYLTVLKDIPTSYDRYLLRIPNEEIKQVYSTEILNNIVQGLNRDTFYNLFDLLFTGRSEEFSYILQKILMQFVSTYDTANKESFYHGFMLGMAALFLGKDYIVESNRESGYGRFDLAIFPNDVRKNGVIMEFKSADSEEQMPQKAQDAIRQINEKHYDEEFYKRGITSIWKYGISFCGKKVCVESTR